ncbi:MAG: polyprenyl synthetase family protein [Bacteroidales bacterium]|nr:polyprenyl synthetase family protein [Bacteroidales bacterium]
MGRIDEIKIPIRTELDRFQKEFADVMKTRVPLLNIITRYLISNKGKQMRPLFVFLSARLLSDASDSTYRAAALIELLHTATLVHDDVVDEASLRRNVFTINALWKNKVAVLVGDFLLSKGMILALEHKEYQLLEIVSKATRQMSEGELLQIEKARRLDISEEIYFDIIRQKTASLIGSATAAGVASVGADSKTIAHFWNLGENIGIAFQIKDDLLDYAGSNTGKTTGNDLKEKKMTLPLIYMLSQTDFLERRKIIMNIKYRSQNAAVRRSIIDKVKLSGGIDYAEQKMQEYLQKALDDLNHFPDTEIKTAFINLINYSINRNK